jgi:hypothetical protein
MRPLYVFIYTFMYMCTTCMCAYICMVYRCVCMMVCVYEASICVYICVCHVRVRICLIHRCVCMIGMVYTCVCNIQYETFLYTLIGLCSYMRSLSIQNTVRI